LPPARVALDIQAREVPYSSLNQQKQLEQQGALDLEGIGARQVCASVLPREDALWQGDEGVNIALIVELTETVAVLRGHPGFAGIEPPTDSAQLFELAGVNFDPVPGHGGKHARDVVSLLGLVAARPVEKETQPVFYRLHSDDVGEGLEALRIAAAVNKRG
jgi:hypothetical protein